MGGLCKHKETGKKGVVLGILKRGITTAKVQWETNCETADVPIALLEHIEPTPFCVQKLTGVTLELLKMITQLSGITNEIKMPHYHLTVDEEKLLLPESTRRKTLNDVFHGCSSDPQLCQVKNPDNCKRNLAKTVESLSNEMVSNIMGEIRKMSSEKAVNQDETEAEVNEERMEMKRQLMIKLLNIEHESLQLAFMQCAALKTLSLLLATNNYSQHFLFPSVFDKETSCEDTTDAIKWIMSHVVNKSIQQCKLKSIVSIAEIERAESILQLNYVKCKSEEDLNKIFNTEIKLPQQQSSQSDTNEFRNILEWPTTCLLRPSSSRLCMSLAFSDTTASCKSLTKQHNNNNHLYLAYEANTSHITITFYLRNLNMP